MGHVRQGSTVVALALCAIVVAACSYSEYNPYCGNGRLEPDNGETCDNAVPAGQAGACPASCTDGDACTTDSVASGSTNECTLLCAYTPVTAAVDGDGCCPAGATSTTDDDCAGSTCGNGVIDSGEACDIGIATGTGACPTSCDDALTCTTDSISGVGCNATCAHTNITTPSQTADGCCPTGGTSGNDVDCPASCGNGVVDLGETCDSGIAAGMNGACPTAAVCNDNVGCTIDSVSGGGCTQQCQHTAITVPSTAAADQCCPGGANNNTDVDCTVACGNGAVEAGEQCDLGIAAGLLGHCPVVSECNDSNACTNDSLTGGGTCGARCEHAQRPLSGPTIDGCCPANGNFTNDADCPAVCGNGALETGAGEVCDTAIAVGNVGHCPANAGECSDGNVCTTDGTNGSSGCARACTNAAITACAVVDDGCCPSGCNANNDGDCSPTCGNGTVEAPPVGNEKCDTAIATGAGLCPTAQSCIDNNACTNDGVSGSTCSAECVNTPITTSDPVIEDGCCPTGANANNDADCIPICGNNVVESGETCDTSIAAGMAGACPSACGDGNACTTDTLTGSACTAACSNVVFTPCCGNGMKESGETCDTGIQIGMPDSCPSTCNDGNTCTNDAATGSACTAACTNTGFTPCCGDGIVTNNGALEETCDTAIAAGTAGSCDNITCVDAYTCTNDTPFPINGDACRRVCPHFAVNSTVTPDSCCPPQSTSTQDIDCLCGNGAKDAATFEQCDASDPANVTPCTSSCTVAGGLFVGSPCAATSDCSLPTAPVGGTKSCVLADTLPPLTSGVVNGYCSVAFCNTASGTPGSPEPRFTSCPQPPGSTGSAQDSSAVCVLLAPSAPTLCLALCNPSHLDNDCRRVEIGPLGAGIGTWAYRCVPQPGGGGVCLPRNPTTPADHL